MLNLSPIRWCDATWGFASGCYDAGPECDHCYARTQAESPYFARAYPNGFDLTLREHKLRDVHTGRLTGLLVFAGSMTDIGLPELPREYFSRVLDAAERAIERDHRVLFLTKRPRDMARRLRELGRRLPDHVWMGTTIGHRSGLGRERELLDIPGAGVKFISAEPLLEDLAERLHLAGVDWLIAGGESGSHYGWPRAMRRAAKDWPLKPAALLAEPWARWWRRRHDGALPPTRALLERGAQAIEDRFLAQRVTVAGRARWTARESRIGWMRQLRERCAWARTAFFLKQWGGAEPDSAGHELDDQVHEAMPERALPAGWLARRSAASKASAGSGAGSVHLHVVS